MAFSEEFGRSDGVTLRRLAQEMGMTPENLKALERRGRLPKGCEPEIDLMTGTRYWTRDQVRQLKEWNEERVKQLRPAEPEGEAASSEELEGEALEEPEEGGE